MYHIHIDDDESHETDSWGEFVHEKTFMVTHDTIQPKDISGFIIQHVIKTTEAYALCSDKVKPRKNLVLGSYRNGSLRVGTFTHKHIKSSKLRSGRLTIHKKITTPPFIHLQKIENIDTFTREQVIHMNADYYELFPVLKGTSVNSDHFGNGAILHYEYDKDMKKWVANNNPPTKGKIIQIGTSGFIPMEKKEVEKIARKIKDQCRPSKKKSCTLMVFDIEWDHTIFSYAKGLPFTTKDIRERIQSFIQSPLKQHTIIAEWDGIGSEAIQQATQQETQATQTTQQCYPLHESNATSNRREAPTTLTSTFEDATEL